MMHPYFSGKYWWVGITAIVLLTLLFFFGLEGRQLHIQPKAKPVVTVTKVAPHVERPAIPPQPVLELFNPSAEDTNRTQAVSRVRGEIEQLLVIAIMLQRCKLIDDNEYASIYASGQRYATYTKLFADNDALMRELLGQAESTYSLVYASTACSESSLQSLKQQTETWQKQFEAMPR